MPTAEYMREYYRRRYAERETKIFAMLGGKCAKCSAKDRLEIDHIDAKSKSFEVKEASWWMAWARLVPEINKCQLLCRHCHEQKTIVDKGNVAAPGTHGTLSSYRYCKCDKCRAAQSAYTREYRKTHPRKRKLPVAQ